MNKLKIKMNVFVQPEEIISDFLEWNDNDDMDIDELNEQFIEWFDSNISQYIDFYLSDGDNSDD